MYYSAPRSSYVGDSLPTHRRETYYGTSYAPHVQRVYEEEIEPYATVDRHYDSRSMTHRDYAPVTAYEPVVERFEGPPMGMHRYGLGRPHHIRKSRNVIPVEYDVVTRPVTRMAGYDHIESDYVPHDMVRTGYRTNTVARDYGHWDARPVRYDIDTYNSTYNRGLRYSDY